MTVDNDTQPWPSSDFERGEDAGEGNAEPFHVDTDVNGSGKRVASGHLKNFDGREIHLYKQSLYLWQRCDLRFWLFSHFKFCFHGTICNAEAFLDKKGLCLQKIKPHLVRG